MDYLPLNKYLIKIIESYVDYSVEHLNKIVPKDRYVFNKYIDRTIMDIIVLALQKGYICSGKS